MRHEEQRTRIDHRPLLSGDWQSEGLGVHPFGVLRRA
jgi:hypothetical protein